MSGLGRTQRAADLARCRSGVAAVEFALIAPMLIVSFLLMLDVGTAIAARMEMDRNVRAGAQAAMSLNNEVASIEAIVLASNEAADALDVDVALQCRCADASAECTSPCAGGAAPSVFVEISAVQEVAGKLMPDRQVRSQTRVQIR